MRPLSPILCPTLWALILLPTSALSSPPVEWRVHEETVGQEYQRQGTAAVHPDGSWTAAWVDYRTGYGSIFVRSFSSQDEPMGPGVPITDGYGLFHYDIKADPAAEPFLAPLDGERSLLVWTEVRYDLPRVRAALVDPSGLVLDPITLNEERPYSTKGAPYVSISGDRALIVWTEGNSPSRKAYGQILTTSFEPILQNFAIDPEGGDTQSNPRAAASDQGWIVVWESELQGSARVLSRPFDRDGLPLAATKVVDSDPEVIQRAPAIVTVPGGCFITWTKGFAGRVSLAGRLLDTDLNPIAPPFLISNEEETVTPRSPELLALDQNSILVLWTAGPAQTQRFHARRVVLPSTASGSIVVVEDPTLPPGQSLTPRDLTLIRGSTTPARLIWSDAREGWELLFQLTTDADGRALTSPTPIDEKEGTASQACPDVVLFPDNRGAVIWEDFRSGVFGIHGAYLDAEGRPQGGSFRISEASGGSASAPADNLRDLLRNQPVLGVTANGSIVAAWTAFLSSGTGVVYQVFDPDGVAIGANTVLSPACPTGIQGLPAFAATRDGGFFLVWWDTCGGGSGDIYARHFLPDGSADSDTICVPDRAYLGAPQISPAVSSGEGGETVITWLDGRMGNNDVYAQRLGPTGIKIEGNIPISIPEQGNFILQSNPDVSSQADRYVIVWDEDPFSGKGVAGLLVVLPSAKSGHDHANERTRFSLAEGGIGLRYPRVAMAPDGRFVVTYWDTSSDSARVMAQRFDPDANPIGVPYSVNLLGGKVATLQGNLAADGTRIRYAFVDNRDGRSWDVRVKTVSWYYAGDLTPVAVAAWTIIEDQDALELRWSVSRDLAGSSYRIWRCDGEGAAGAPEPGPAALLIGPEPVAPILPGGSDYSFRDASAAPGTPYLYWIQDAGGEFAGPWAGARSGTKAALALRAIDNPFAETTRLAWSLPRSGEADLAVYDLSGRLVRTLLPSRRRAPGSGEQVWDGRDAEGRDVPAGVYWARLRLSPGGERSVKLLRFR